MCLPEYKILDPSVDTLPSETLRQIQSQRLVNMVHYVYERSPFWRRKFQEVGLHPNDVKGLEDLPRIPFCTKAELQKDQEENPPFGSYTCSPPSHWIHFMTTSGTTGRPLRRLFSNRDANYVVDFFQRRGLPYGPGDIFVFLGPTDSLSGPTFFVRPAWALTWW